MHFAAETNILSSSWSLCPVAWFAGGFPQFFPTKFTRRTVRYVTSYCLVCRTVLVNFLHTLARKTVLKQQLNCVFAELLPKRPYATKVKKVVHNKKVRNRIASSFQPQTRGLILESRERNFKEKC